MSFFQNMLALQLMLLCLIAGGIIVKKSGVINETGRKNLSDLLINVILPCNIVQSFMSGTQISGEFFRNCALMVLLSAVIQIFAVFSSKLLFRKYSRERRNVLTYGIICSNSSFIGLPVADILFGDIGVMYTSMFQIPIRFTMWTAGLSLFTSVEKKDAVRKLVRHPCIVSIVIGIVLMLVPIQFPGFLVEAISSVSKCATPVSMIVIGSILADASPRSLFSRSVLYYVFLRLLAVPLLWHFILLPFHLDSLLVDICLLMTGMPAGSTVGILADKYDCDPAFASQITFASTLCSVATLPLLTLLM